MLGAKKQSQLDRMRTAVREAVSYVDEIASDERLRADLRAAVGHGVEARDRIRMDVTSGSIATRLANDRKLRKKIRAVLDDLDNASDRLRRRNRRRLRNVLLILGSVGAAAVATPNVRRRLPGSALARETVDGGTAV
ncbi:MAG: hypothetical protein ACM3QU_16070 [Verrucomicrobiota bacterium]